MALLKRNGSSGSFVRSRALKLCILKNGLFLLPLPSFPLERHTFAVGAGGPTLILIQCDFFVCLFQEQEGVCHRWHWLCLAQPLGKYPCPVSSLDTFSASH